EAGCHLVYQPPYSPDLNPIEHFWSWLKEKIRSLKIEFSSLDDSICFALS
ncbi:MAG: transposase, partial [Holosporaceae bacterium]|nr:transposase [Holosporaceae bacterium]